MSMNQLLEAFTDSPTSPNFHFCSHRYGENLHPKSCFDAADHLPLDKGWKSYTSDGRGPFNLPWAWQVGGCTVRVDMAGPNVETGSGLVLEPFKLHAAAEWVVSQCAKNGIGGFVTGGVQNLVTYVHGREVLPEQQYPPSTSFVTVTVLGPGGMVKPGDYDPSVPLALWFSRATDGTSTDMNDPLYRAAQEMEKRLAREFSNLAPKPWWEHILPHVFELEPAQTASPLEG